MGRNDKPPEAQRSQLGSGTAAERIQKGQRTEQFEVIRDEPE